MWCPAERYFWLGTGHLRLTMAFNMFKQIFDIQDVEGEPADYQSSTIPFEFHDLSSACSHNRDAYPEVKAADQAGPPFC